MPRPGPRLPAIAVRMDPADIDAEAARESKNQNREVSRSEMMTTLIAEALAARQRRRNRKGKT